MENLLISIVWIYVLSVVLSIYFTIIHWNENELYEYPIAPLFLGIIICCIVPILNSLYVIDEFNYLMNKEND